MEGEGGGGKGLVEKVAKAFVPIAAGSVEAIRSLGESA